MGMVAILVMWATWVEQILSPSHKRHMNLTYCKEDQGQPRIIIWIIFVRVLNAVTKFERIQPAGYGEIDFYRVFTIYGHGGHLGHMTRTIWTNFLSSSP